MENWLIKQRTKRKIKEGEAQEAVSTWVHYISKNKINIFQSSSSISTGPKTIFNISLPNFC